MEHNERDLTLPILIASIIFMIIALGTYIYFENRYKKAHPQSGMTTSTLGTLTQLNDIYPLYPDVLWNDTETIVTRIEDVTFENFQIRSKPLTHVKDMKPIASSFHKYYDDKLKVMGWGEGDGSSERIASSQWTYKKGSQYIILSYEQNMFTIITGGHQ